MNSPWGIFGSVIPQSLIADPLFPFYVGGFLVFALIAIAVHVLKSGEDRQKERMTSLARELADLTQKLTEAERIGHFGSFTWDLKNPSESFWSLEMYNLFGLVARKKPPTPDIFITAAPEMEKKRIEKEWRRAQLHSGPFELTLTALSPSGQARTLKIQGQQENARIQGVAHDMTKEEEIDRAKTEFVSLASHQLKTPLTAIKWLSEVMLENAEKKFSKDELKYAGNIHEATQNMIAIVNDLLNVSRIDLGTLGINREDFDIAELAQSVVDEQRQSAEHKHIILELTAQHTLPKLFGDKGLARMVLQNLVSNAIKYTPEKGHVRCEITEGGGSRDTVFISVADSGIGIPKSAREHIFQKLYRAENAQTFVTDGTGLGLYVVKTVLDRIHGGITFESSEGKGTTFYVSMPVHWDTSVPEA